MALSQRKPIRLKNYNYSSGGAYFITLCIQNRHEILGKVSVGDGVLDVPQVELSNYGLAVKNRIKIMASIYTHLKITNYVIMPNHIHLIIVVQPGNENLMRSGGMSRTPSPTNAVIPRFVSTLKRYTNREIGFSIWQRSYNDHIIRDEQEYNKIWEYIDTNPSKWVDDRYYAN